MQNSRQTANDHLQSSGHYFLTLDCRHRQASRYNKVDGEAFSKAHKRLARILARSNRYPLHNHSDRLPKGIWPQIDR